MIPILILTLRCLCCGSNRLYHNGYCHGCTVAYCKARRAWGEGCGKR
jgi:hypothetical protein